MGELTKIFAYIQFQREEPDVMVQYPPLTISAFEFICTLMFWILWLDVNSEQFNE